MLNKDLDLFIRLFDMKPPSLKVDKIKMAKQIISRYSLPERYLAGLNKDEKFIRQIELISKKRQSSTQRFIQL